MKTRRLYLGAWLVGGVLCSLQVAAATLPFEIDLAQPSGTEGTPFTRAYAGPRDGMATGNQNVAVADFNGDGYDDYAIGYANYAPEDAPDTRRGRVVIVYGGPDTPATLDLGDPAGKTVITCSDDLAEFGYSVATGDLAGSGLPGLIVGAPGALENKGAVLLFFNSDLQPGSTHSVNTNDAMSTSVETRYLGVDDAGRLGYSVLAANLNPNAPFEVVMAAPNAMRGSDPDSGKVYVVFGTTRTYTGTQLVTDDSEQWEIQGAAGAGLGEFLAAGDFDGDGLTDLAISAPSLGMVYILFSVSPGPETFDLADSNTFPLIGRLFGFARLGQSMAVGDLNDDGREDLLIGMPLHTVNGLVAAGGAVLLAGRASLMGANINLDNGAESGILKMPGYQEQEFAGYSVGLGDLDGDGREDICVGAPFANAADGTDGFYGRVMYFTNQGLPSDYQERQLNVGPRQIYGASAVSFLGANLNALGDLNRDGRADLLMTATSEVSPAETGEGTVYALYGDGTAQTGGAVRQQISGETFLDAIGGPLTPVLRTRVKFDGGSGGAVSSTITRNKQAIENLGNGLGTNIAPVYWQISTTRATWTLATVELQYTDAEIVGFNEDYIAVYQAPAADGPWTRAAGQTHDPDSNHFTVENGQLGFYAILSEAPVITLVGSSEQFLECSIPFSDPGFTALAADGTDLTDQVVVSGDTVNEFALDAYVLTYFVEDASNIPATVTRTVIVRDTGTPYIEDDNYNINIECNSTFIFSPVPGMGQDDCWGDISDFLVAANGQIDTSVLGQQQLVVNLSDPSGNTAPETIISMSVKDTTPPEIQLLGDNPMYVPCFEEFVEPGVTLSDTCDDAENLTVQFFGQQVNTEVVDTYTLFYDARDSNGNISLPISRDVIVVGFCGLPGSDDDCPNDSIDVQPLASNYTSYSSNVSGNTLFETFENPQNLPIGKVTWWGKTNQLGDTPCVREPNSFRIAFHEIADTQDGNRPGDLLAEYTVTPVVEDTGIVDAFNSPVYRFSAELNPSVAFDPLAANTTRMLSIVGVENDSCRFLWTLGISGDGQVIRKFSNGTFDTFTTLDLAYCLQPGELAEGEGEGQTEGEGELEDSLDCPPNSSFSQAPVYNGFSFPGSGLIQSHGAFSHAERFSGVPEGVGRVYWWGHELNSLPLTAFKINFYADGETPGALLYSFDVNAESVGTGRLRVGKEVIRYSANLPEEVLLSSGWISIGGTEEGKTFLLLFSSAGDQRSLYIDGSGTVISVRLYDPNLCLLPAEALEGEGEGEGQTDGEGEAGDPQFACPDGALFSQPIDLSAGGDYFSDTLKSVYVYDKFSGLSEVIGGVVWWGFSFKTGSGPCIRDSRRYRIDFFEDDAGGLGTLVESKEVTAEVLEVGNTTFVPNRKVFRFSARFDAPVTLTDGWISIVGLDETECAFAWHASDFGDGCLSGTGPLDTTVFSRNRAFCLLKPNPYEALLYTFASAETSGDKLLSLEEIQAQLPGFTQEDLDGADANGDGLLSVAELLAKLGNVILLSLDTNGDFEISLSELVRVIQLFNSENGYACAANPGATEDGYLPRGFVGGDPPCTRHVIDRNGDRIITLSELLRAIQFYNLRTYTYCLGINGEDSFCPGT